MAVSRAINAVEERVEERPPENLMPQNITTVKESEKPEEKSSYKQTDVILGNR